MKFREVVSALALAFALGVVWGGVSLLVAWWIGA